MTSWLAVRRQETSESEAREYEMTDFYQLPHAEQLRRLLLLAETAVERYDLPSGVSVKMINLSENATYKVEDGVSGRKWALRVHREGYHSKNAIASELAWCIALRREADVLTPVPVSGKDGALIQVVAHELLPRPRHIVLFDWESGSEPAENDVAGFEILGETAARMHRHVRGWKSPPISSATPGISRRASARRRIGAAGRTAWD